MNDEEFELDEESDIVKPKNPKYKFLKKVEENLDLSDGLQTDRMQEMERLIMEQMKTTIKRKLARGEKRQADDKSDENAQSKARVKSPPKTLES